jgi:hypothetical protein
MTHVFLERTFDPPITDADFQDMLESSASCVGIHRVDWCGSLMSTDGSQLLCRFTGPDAESVRTAMRQAGSGEGTLWPGTIHDAPGFSDEEIETANVVVQRCFDEPVDLEDIQAIEDRGAACLEMRNVKFMRTYFSNDRKHMVCLYRAPDAESVRQAQIKAEMPLHAVWAFRRYEPEAAGQ